MEAIMTAEQAQIYLSNNEADQIEKINEAYISLSKWLIGLSTGAIVFIVGISKSRGFWKWELAVGLFFLIISILVGIRFVSLLIDKSFFKMGITVTEKLLNYFKNKDSEAEYEFESKIVKVKDILRNLTKDYNDWVHDIKKIRSKHVACFSWQKRLFYIGIVMIALFGLFNI